MARNPCPCMPLQTGVKLFAVIDAVLSAFSLVLFVCILLALLFYKGEKGTEEGYKMDLVVVSGVVILIASFQFLIAVRLYHGAKHKDSSKCMSWLAGTFISIAIYIISLLSNRIYEDNQAESIAVIVMLIIYKVFGVGVVATFTDTQKQDNQLRGVYIFPPVSARQPESSYPGSHVFSIEPPPPYFHIQKHVTEIDPPPPYYTNSIINSHSGTSNSGV